MKITTKVALKVSRLVSKLDIKIPDPKKDAYEIGSDLVMQVVKRIGECEEEVIEIIMALFGLTKEEAEELDLIAAFEKERQEGGAISFLLSAVKSQQKE